jgi:hypothetical protein
VNENFIGIEVSFVNLSPKSCNTFVKDAAANTTIEDLSEAAAKLGTLSSNSQSVIQGFSIAFMMVCLLMFVMSECSERQANVLYMAEYNEIRTREIMFDRRAASTQLLSVWLLCLYGTALSVPAYADGAASQTGNTDLGSASADFISKWFAISDHAKEVQPHWMTPLVTVTARLEQEVRYDQVWQERKGDVNIDNYGNGKGLEVIPTANTELILGVPAYQIRTAPKGKKAQGWADETALVKYRFVAANEENGNYIVTGFLGYSFPTGSAAFTAGKGIVTPTIAAGKGWGTRELGFNVQSTLGVAIPVKNEQTIGTTTTWNTSLQAHVGKLWPEIEANYTSYRDAGRDGKHQLAFTAGVIAGRFELGSRARLILGLGYQWPVSNFRIYERNWLATGRIAF